MYTLNLRKKDIKWQLELVLDFGNNSLKNIIDSNIINRIPGKNNFL